MRSESINRINQIYNYDILIVKISNFIDNCINIYLTEWGTLYPLLVIQTIFSSILCSVLAVALKFQKLSM